jgi:hypothetical protein
MAQRTFGRVLAGIALAAVLTLAGPTPAQAAPRIGSDVVWSWVSALWDGTVGALWGVPARTNPDHGPKMGLPLQKQGGCVDPNGCAPRPNAGVCIDPNGCTPRPSSSTSRPSCAAWTDAGPCIDPNG